MHRRKFLQFLARIANGSIAVILGLPAIRFLFAGPREARSRREFVRVGPLDMLPPGQPLRVTISEDRWDAYMHYPRTPIGAVWLYRPTENDPTGIKCWQSICPHLGCGIDYAPERGAFSCPCHRSEFSLIGEVRFGPSPRSMDELECRIVADSGQDWIEVLYEEFEIGHQQKQTLS